MHRAILLRVVLAIGLFATMNSAPVQGQTIAPMSLDGLYQLDRVADPQLSPDGKLVVYQVTRILDAAKNQKTTQLWLSNTDGSGVRQLSHSQKADSHARWSPDGSKILFESNRDGSQQLYVLDVVLGGEAKKLTAISTGASNAVWAPDGKSVAFLSTVRPEFSELLFAESDAKNKEAEDAASSSLVKAKTFKRLFYRHWDSYVEDKRNHLFVINVDGSDCRDVTPGDRDAYPTSSTFSAGDEFTFSPDSKSLVFTAVPKDGESWSTNHDLCRVAIDNKSKDWQAITTGKAAESLLKFSPDGKQAAFRMQFKPGYEADKWELMIQDCNLDGTLRGEPFSLTHDLDSPVTDFSWVNNNDLIFTSDEFASSVLYRVSKGAKPSRMSVPFEAGRMGQLTGHSVRGEQLVLARATMNEPAELYFGTLTSSKLAAITQHNKKLLDSWERPKPESLLVAVEGAVNMQMWILKPPAFDPAKKWPVVYLVHGGPQGAWEDGWSFRWNPQLWAAQGYIVVLPNPRGSTSFGQKFCDEISGDWGGKCYRDLLAGLNMIKSLDYVDSSRIASAGASFGGYMQNWFAVNEISKEFRCLVTHCSVYNFESMWGTTDELWFDEYEHGGLPWELPEKYREFSPQRMAGNLGKYKTPMLVIHNDLDFRCPIGQGHELFQALQRQGVPSKFINFPDEGHWVNKTANSLHWHREIFSWLREYCPPGVK